MLAVAFTSQGFVKALKNPADPLSADGPLKIDIAEQGWRDASLYVPNKAEVIAEWILVKLLKDRSMESSTNPILDLRFWTLLSDVISPQKDGSRSTSWLAQLLNRIPIAPIISSFLSLLNEQTFECRLELTLAAAQCLSILWPIAAQKMIIDTLLDCLGVFMMFYMDNHSHEGTLRIGQLVCSSYRNSLGNTSNKKKVHSIFLQSYLQQWLECVQLEHPTPGSQAMIREFRDLGRETLFSPEVLRYNASVASNAALLEALKDISISSPGWLDVVFKGIPIIIALYVESLKKHRQLLFTGMIAEEMKTAGIRLLLSCLPLLETGADGQVWPTRVALLSLVLEENLFSITNADATHSMRSTIELSLSALDGIQQDEEPNIHLAVECLSIIARIDYTLIEPKIPSILSRLLLISGANQIIFLLLETLLTYHSKTRTIDAYSSYLFQAFLPQAQWALIPCGRGQVYRYCSSAPLVHYVHLARISADIENFLSPGQVLPLVNLIIQALRNAWLQLSGNGTDNPGGQPDFATTFALSTQTASAIFTSLPLGSIEESRKLEAQRLIRDLDTSVICPILARVFKTLRKKEHDDTWTFQIVAAATLRLLYALTVCRKYSLEGQTHDGLLPRMVRLLKDRTLIPELRIEMFRHLLHRSVPGVVNPLLAEFSRITPSPSEFWSGQPHQLGAGDEGPTMLALYHLVISRWMPFIDAVASGPELEEFIRCILCLCSDSGLEHPSPERISAGSLRLQVLGSAQFWEMPNMRAALLLHAKEGMRIFENDALGISYSALLLASAFFELLLTFPVEFIPRPLRLDLSERAISADIAIIRLCTDGQITPGKACGLLTTLRSFLGHVFIHQGVIEQTPEKIHKILGHLVHSREPPSDSSNSEYTAATVSLIRLYEHELLQAAQKNDSSFLLRFMNSFPTNTLGLPSLSVSPANKICGQAFSQMIEILTAKFTLSNFPEDVCVEMRDIYQRHSSALHPLLAELAINGFPLDGLEFHSRVLLGWSRLLSFGRWLGIPRDNAPPLGMCLSAKVGEMDRTIAPDCSEELKSAIFDITLQEFHCVSGAKRLAHLDMVVASYITLCCETEQSSHKHFDNYLSSASPFLSVLDFEHILELGSESLSCAKINPHNLIKLICFVTVVLQEPPKGSLKLIQQFITKTLNNFVTNTRFSTGHTELRRSVLDFVFSHCSERPATLRQADLASIWSLLFMFLSGAGTHDQHTAKDFFHKIVGIINCLIRFRRDLVTLTLPHLGAILCHLVMTMRHPRAQLGAKQISIVTSTLPQWINAPEPLGVGEAKALARLLGTLQTKSIVRSHGSLPTTQKAESLAKPFSKHAAYVQKAYIDALNDPLCIIPSEVRKEFQPGLYALCGMMNDYSRDAVMVSGLDVGGKVIMKSLWKEYEKQRYIGRG